MDRRDEIDAHIKTLTDGITGSIMGGSGLETVAKALNTELQSAEADVAAANAARAVAEAATKAAQDAASMAKVERDHAVNELDALKLLVSKTFNDIGITDPTLDGLMFEVRDEVLYLRAEVKRLADLLAEEEPPVTPAPVTDAPLTEKPITEAPVTPKPETPAPVTLPPATPAPITEAPVTTPPITPAPITPKPVTSAPIPPNTTDWPKNTPPSTCGIAVLSNGIYLPMTRQRDGTFLPGCVVNHYFRDMSGVLMVGKDSLAVSGPAGGTLRWRVAMETDPYLGITRTWSSAGRLLNVNTPAGQWPASNSITLHDLTNAAPPVVDAQGNKVWRVEIAADEGGSTHRGVVTFAILLAPGNEPPRPPAEPYHSSEIIPACSFFVYPFNPITDSSSIFSGKLPLFVNWARQRALVAQEPALSKRLGQVANDAWSNKWSEANGYYSGITPRAQYRWVSHFTTGKDEYSLAVTAAQGVNRLFGTMTPAKQAHIRDLVLDNPGVPAELGLAEHANYHRFVCHGYDAVEPMFTAVLAYLWHRDDGLWTTSEEARIRDWMARFVHTTKLMHKNPLRQWITAGGYCAAMWENARDLLCSLIAAALDTHGGEDRYGASASWLSFFLKGVKEAGFTTGSGLYGMLENSNPPRWNDAGGRYWRGHLCAAQYGIVASALAEVGLSAPAHWQQAFLLSLDDQLGDVQTGPYWTPLFTHDPVYKAALEAKVGRSEVIRMSTQISAETGQRTLTTPGGLGGAGGDVMSMLWVR